jgi:hypothetical protein
LKEEAAGEAEGGEGKNAGIWEREHSAGGVYCGAADGGGISRPQLRSGREATRGAAFLHDAQFDVVFTPTRTASLGAT